MMNLRKMDWQNVGWAVLPWVLHLPSLRPIFRFVPHGELVGALYVLLAVGVSWWVLRPERRERLIQLLDMAWVFWAGLGVMAVIAMVVYPYADGLKAVGRGSDGDDAMFLGVQSWLEFGNPYHFITYLGGYLSPGPGWILLVMPLVLTGLYALLTPVSVALVAWAARCEGIGWGKINLAIGLLFGSVAAWEMTTTGIDHIPIALCLLALLMRIWRVRGWDLALFVVVLGLLATSRIVFIYWPVLVAFTLVPVQGWRKAFAVAAGGVLVAAGWHVWGWATAPGVYHPLHVLSKPQDYDGSGGMLFAVATLAVCAVAGLLMLWNWKVWPRYVHMWVGVFVPLFCTGLSELLHGGNVGYTTLASYTMLGAPFLLAALVFETEKGRV